jgi:hypothetical protein
MKDLRSQLAAQFGVAPPDVDGDDDPVTQPDPLGPDGHIDAPWLDTLRGALQVTGLEALPDRPKLARCQQAAAQAIKALKKSGRGADARDLAKQRDDYLADRAKLAWARVKARFVDLGLSDKAYRALKQGAADPERVLRGLDKTDASTLQGMGAARLREHLLG